MVVILCDVSSEILGRHLEKAKFFYIGDKYVENAGNDVDNSNKRNLVFLSLTPCILNYTKQYQRAMMTATSETLFSDIMNGQIVRFNITRCPLFA